MGNPLLAMNQPQGPAPAPGPAPPGNAPAQAVGPQDIQKAHGFADSVMTELTGLLGKPAGQLSKQDVFQGAASLLGKGLFNDPQSRAGLVTSLIGLPDDETALRKILGDQLLQMAGLKRRLDEHSAQMGQGAPMPQGA